MKLIAMYSAIISFYDKSEPRMSVPPSVQKMEVERSRPWLEVVVVPFAFAVSV